MPTASSNSPRRCCAGCATRRPRSKPCRPRSQTQPSLQAAWIGAFRVASPASLVLSCSPACHPRKRLWKRCAGPLRRDATLGRPHDQRLDLAAAQGCPLARPVEAGERPHPMDINFFSEYAVAQMANALAWWVRHVHGLREWQRWRAAFHYVSATDETSGYEPERQSTNRFPPNESRRFSERASEFAGEPVSR